MVVAGHDQHAAMPDGAGMVAVLQHVERAVDARPLAVPEREHAVVFGAGEQADLLAAPDRGGGQILVQARLEADMLLRPGTCCARHSAWSSPPSGEPR